MAAAMGCCHSASSNRKLTAVAAFLLAAETSAPLQNAVPPPHGTVATHQPLHPGYCTAK